MKTVSLLILICIFAGSFASSVVACSCVENPSVEVALQKSDAVFSGNVIDVREKRQPNGYRPKSVHFEVIDTWKGVEETQIIIVTGLGGGDCGFDFKEGQEYLVYANESTMYGDKSLVAIICSRTTELSLAQEDLLILGEGELPTNEVDLTVQQAGSQLNLWIGIVIALFTFLILVLGLKAWSRKRR